MNLYRICNGDYYTYVAVIAKDEEEAIELAREVYKDNGSQYDNLYGYLEIENINGSVASGVLEA